MKPAAYFSKIRKISVVSFEGTGGSEVTVEFVRQLLARGLEVTDGQHPGDAVLRGVVVDYKPSNTLMVFLGKTTVLVPGGQPVTVNNPILSPGAAQVTPDAAVVGTQNAQVASVSAAVGVEARLTDPSSGAALWAGRYSYEAVDMPGAVQTVVGALAQSLSRAVHPVNEHSL